MEESSGTRPATIEERLVAAEARIEMLDQELFGAMMVIAHLIHTRPDADDRYQWLCVQANRIEERGTDPDAVRAIDAIRDLVDAHRDGPGQT